MRRFKLLEKSIGGFNFGELIVIGGRPYMKKERLIEQIINAVVSDKVKALYLFNPINEYSNFKDYNIRLLSSSEDVDSLVDIIRKEVENNNLSIVFIDNIERISYSSGWLSGNIRKEVASMLKRLAMSLHIPILVLSELSEKVETRQPNNPKPILKDLNGVEYFADKVILINRPEYYGITEDAEGLETEDIYFMEIFKKDKTKSEVIRYELKKNAIEFIELGTAKYY